MRRRQAKAFKIATALRVRRGSGRNELAAAFARRGDPANYQGTMAAATPRCASRRNSGEVG